MSHKRSQNPCKRCRGQSATSMKTLSICMTMLQLNSSVTAFSPGSQENNRDGPLCPRRSTLPTIKSKGKLPLARNRLDHLDNIGNNFAMRMAQQSEEVQTAHTERLLHNDSIILDEINDEENVLERRTFLQRMLTATSAGLSMPSISNAYDKAYPVNLDFANDDSSRNVESIRTERISVKRAKVKQSKDDILQQPLAFRNVKDAFGSVAWSGALWLLLGSRSNPLVKPLANALYDTNTRKGAWVKDRNDGLFAPFPAAFSILMGIVFLFLGIFVDRTLLLTSEGDSNGILQLAGVSLIGGASLELGRVALGEKRKTRDDAERDLSLAKEFEEFASKKLLYGQGGSAHRSEVINSFRRYFAKYRVDNDQYPLGDLEIEQVLRAWNKTVGNQESMSPSGFIKNIKINSKAEIKT
eukprot:scaffold3797_cov267-Chaetoceros_neogracile.AAC.19